MLFSALVVEADFVVGRGAQDVTFVIANGDVVAVRRVVQHARDIRPVRVTILKANRHLRPRQQRQVQAVSVSGIRPRLADPQALEPGFPARPVKQHIHPVAPVFVDMPVGVVFPGAGHAGRQRPGHHRTRAGLRPVADVRAVRYAGKLHRKVGIAPGVAVHRRDEHAISKLPGHLLSAGDLQHLSRAERRAAGGGLHPGLAVKITLMAKPGVKRPGLRRRMAVMDIPGGQVVISPVVSLTKGGGLPAGDIHLRVHVRRRLAVVVVAGTDLLLHDAVAACHLPHRVHPGRLLP
ncbi:Uncharacterised protein [Klebsiella pneumoniae]|nr:Uncharacterised protein [Klebsiella pneumoniae]